MLKLIYKSRVKFSSLLRVVIYLYSIILAINISYEHKQP
jgi:hypothetical protein